MQTYLTVVFCLGILSVFVRSCWLIGEHPRVESINAGSEVLMWAMSVGMLVWISYLKFWV
jgi:hypothetical protein